jgi:glucan phosphorylase
MFVPAWELRQFTLHTPAPFRFETWNVSELSWYLSHVYSLDMFRLSFC